MDVVSGFRSVVHHPRFSFDFAEKAEVDKYYPKYYHKMDRVSMFLSGLEQSPEYLTSLDAPYTLKFSGS